MTPAERAAERVRAVRRLEELCARIEFHEREARILKFELEQLTLLLEEDNG